MWIDIDFEFLKYIKSFEYINIRIILKISRTIKNK